MEHVWITRGEAKRFQAMLRVGDWAVVDQPDKELRSITHLPTGVAVSTCHDGDDDFPDEDGLRALLTELDALPHFTLQNATEFAPGILHILAAHNVLPGGG